MLNFEDDTPAAPGRPAMPPMGMPPGMEAMPRLQPRMPEPTPAWTPTIPVPPFEKGGLGGIFPFSSASFSCPSRESASK